MSEAEILTALTAIFRDCFGDAALVLTRSTRSSDIRAWDSNKMVALVLAVEERFGITLTSREMDRLRSVGDWVGVLAARGVIA